MFVITSLKIFIGDVYESVIDCYVGFIFWGSLISRLWKDLTLWEPIISFHLDVTCMDLRVRDLDLDVPPEDLNDSQSLLLWGFTPNFEGLKRHDYD